MNTIQLMTASEKYQIAVDAATQAANQSMNRGKRMQWNKGDREIAEGMMETLWPRPQPVPVVMSQ